MFSRFLSPIVWCCFRLPQQCLRNIIKDKDRDKEEDKDKSRVHCTCSTSIRTNFGLVFWNSWDFTHSVQFLTQSSCVEFLNVEHDYSNEKNNLGNKNKSVIFKIYFMSTTQNILTGIGTFTVTLKNCIFRDGRSVSEIKAWFWTFHEITLWV